MKSRLVLQILMLGYKVFLSDVDVYWFEDPLAYEYNVLLIDLPLSPYFSIFGLTHLSFLPSLSPDLYHTCRTPVRESNPLSIGFY